MPIIKIDDINMYYEIQGESNVISLVLISGLGTDLTVYREIITQLSKKFKVLAFDNRGAGRTDKPDIPYSIEMMAGDTANLMKAVGIKKANVLGISLGGRIALELCLKYPNMVNSLILVSTSPRVNNEQSLRPKLMQLGFRIGAIIKKNPQPKYAFEHQLGASRNYNCSDQLKKVNVPTLILHGRKDKVASYKFAEEMNESIENSKLITFKGGHYIFLLELKRFTESVSDFISN